MSDGVVLLRGANVEPDAPQAVKRLQINARYVRVIVPERAAVPGGVVGEERDKY